MDKHEVARILDEIALFLEIEGENPFKVRAYHTAARSVEDLSADLDTLIKEGQLQEIPGIGAGIAEKITTLVLKGRLPYYEKLKKAIPYFVLELMTVPGLGPRKALKLCETLKINTLEDLVSACEKGKVAELSGFGVKTQENILRNIGKVKTYSKRVLWMSAGKLAFPIVEGLSKLKAVKKVDVAGSFRRKLETVGDLDFLVASDNPEPIMEWFTTQKGIEIVQARGKTKASVRLYKGMQADLRVVPEEEFAFALVYFTGSKEFNIQLRRLALQQGYTLNEYGLFPLQGKKKKSVVCNTEEELFNKLKLDYIPPELREGYLEIEAAMEGTLPKLLEEDDIQGVFHCHTTDSDGHNNLEEMAQGAAELGLKYIGIADHSQSSYQANGMDEDRLFNQIERIHKFNQSGKCKAYVFAGIECDILQDGTLDFPDDILKELDFVIVSAHRAYKLDEKAMTKRLIKAIENPYATMLGHVTGRILLKREPYPVNIPKVIDACIANGKIIELNAHPMRLDMDWRFWHQASEKGLMCSINPDAHSIPELRHYLTGVNIARKGWLTKSSVLTTFSLADVKKYLKKSRHA